MAKIKELSQEDRPRERLFKNSPTALSTYELIAILLRTGTKNKSVIELSKEILKEFGSLKNLFSASQEELFKIKGLHTAKVATLLSAIELAKRYEKEAEVKNPVVKGPKDVFDLYKSEFYQNGNIESFLCLFLNSKNEVIREERLGSSLTNACLIHPQEFVRGLVKYGASRIILVHNHPSNDLNPSEQDIRFSKELSNGLKYFGFELLDHIIFTQNGFFSMKDKGLI